MREEMKTLDVMVVGELNVDIILNGIASFPAIGKEILAENITLTLGSSAAIFASNLSSLGAKVGFIGRLGNDYFGDFILDHLRCTGVDTDEVIQSDSLPTGTTLVMSYGDDRANITHLGAMESLTIADVKESSIRQARHLHFSSYFLQPGIQHDLKHLFITAKNAGLTTSFDAQWDPSEKWDLPLAELLPHVDVFFPNEIEAIHLTRSKNLDEAIDVLRHFSTATIIKMGNRGSLSVHGDEHLHLPAFTNHQSIDTIGAGDSFNAGFIFKYLQNNPIAACQAFGNLIGAVSTTAAGGTGAFKDPKELKKIAGEKFGYNKGGFYDE
jgi:sugar/nucleoside kinase (ribokinase family)